MNRLQKYEQLMADKLQATPTPDVNGSWKQMHELLNKHQTATGITAWKWSSAIAIFCTLILWWLAENDRMQKHQLTVAAKTIATTNALKKNQLALPNNSRPLANLPNHDLNYWPNSSVAATRAEAHFNTINYHFTIKNIAAANGQPNSFKPNLPSPNYTTADRVAAQTFRLLRSSNYMPPVLNKKKQVFASSTTKAIHEAAAINPSTTSVNNEQQRFLIPTVNTPMMPQVQASLGSLASSTEKENSLTQQLAATSLKQREKIKNLRAADKWARKTARRDRMTNAWSGLFKPFSLKANDEASWWAVGLSLANAVNIQDQKRVAYNINAKSNLALDYLPSPYVQYHINGNVYLQTELNLSAPQPTPQLLITQNSRQQQGNTLQRSVFLQKLYYFNVPLSLHYSPIAHLYIGGGLQFSSLQSGIALLQERNLANNNIVNNVVTKFKDDSTAAKLTPNEWRWQTTADYYWKRVTIGLRYNQSFSNLVNAPALSPFKYNNNSFLFFIKYNLFEGRKKEAE